MSTAIVDLITATIISSRIIDAPTSSVFKAFSNPENLKHWWGPAGFTNTINRFEFRPDGIWEFIMHGPDGTDYHNRCELKEIVTNEKIVFLHFLPVHFFTMTLGFESIGEKTKFSFTMVFEDQAEVEKIKHIVVPANEQNFDKLEEFISKNLKSL